ncbi:MAG: SRPBCC family protein [Hyphomicrobiales bacterium]
MAASGKIEDRTLIISRRFAAPPKAVFDAWVSEDKFSQWMGPEGFSVPTCENDAKPGGHFRVVVKSPDGNENIATGTYEEIASPERLVLTWGWNYPEGRGHATAITVELAAVGDETEMTMHQALFGEREHRDNHMQGWNASLDKMAGLFS